MRTGRTLAVACACCALTESVASAQPAPSLDLRGFHPSTAPEASLYLESSSTPGPWEWNVGTWASHAWRPVVLRDASGARVASVIEHQLSLDYLASVGLGERLALGLALPSILYQHGDDVSAYPGTGTLPRTAIGDLAVTAKASLITPGNLGGFGLAALGRVTTPTGDRQSFVGEGSVSGELRLLGELKLIAVDVQATAGAHVRGAERTYVGESFGHELPWGIGATFLPRSIGIDDKGRWRWTVEFHGAVAVTPSFASGPQSPALAGLSARYAVGDVTLLAGVELPLGDAVGTPLLRSVLGATWAPRFHDADGDGVEDDVDQCPELAEDRDNFEDADGCPDFDNDGDGVPDDSDKCPTAIEDQDGFQDDDGCPDPDNDGDKIPDTADACPNEAGPSSPDPKHNGCPIKDADGDGVPDWADRCPNQPEDFDGFRDEDGCPDPDNDRDGVPDDEDACPNERGPMRSDAKLNGCPNPDRDGDTYDDAQDKCPNEPEDFDGVDDEDGCPDDDSQKPVAQRAKPLVVLDDRDPRALRLRIPLAFRKDEPSELDATSIMTLRAIATELSKHPAYVLLVGVRPVGITADAQQLALNRSFSVVLGLRTLSHRDEIAESVGWSAVQNQPGARAAGIGFMILGPRAAATPPATPAQTAAPGPGPSKLAAPTPTPVTPAAPAPTPAKPPTPAPAPAKPAPAPTPGAAPPTAPKP